MNSDIKKTWTTWMMEGHRVYTSDCGQKGQYFNNNDFVYNKHDATKSDE